MVVIVAAVVVGGGTAVGRTLLDPTGIPDGQLQLEWRGAFRGQATLPAQLQWCPITRLGTLEAISNDTGMLVSLRERDSLSTGIHPILAPELGGELPLPSAVASLRWVRDTGTIVGFQGQHGAVDIEAVGTTASGSFDIGMRRAFRADTVRVRGNFRNIPVVATAVGCP
jgi:hypothetical protein